METTTKVDMISRRNKPATSGSLAQKLYIFATTKLFPVYFVAPYEDPKNAFILKEYFASLQESPINDIRDLKDRIFSTLVSFIKDLFFEIIKLQEVLNVRFERTELIVERKKSNGEDDSSIVQLEFMTGFEAYVSILNQRVTEFMNIFPDLAEDFVTIDLDFCETRKSKPSAAPFNPVNIFDNQGPNSFSDIFKTLLNDEKMMTPLLNLASKIKHPENETTQSDDPNVITLLRKSDEVTIEQPLNPQQNIDDIALD